MEKLRSVRDADGGASLRRIQRGRRNGGEEIENKGWQIDEALRGGKESSRVSLMFVADRSSLPFRIISL